MTDCVGRACSHRQQLEACRCDSGRDLGGQDTSCQIPKQLGSPQLPVLSVGTERTLWLLGARGFWQESRPSRAQQGRASWQSSEARTAFSRVVPLVSQLPGPTSRGRGRVLTARAHRAAVGSQRAPQGWRPMSRRHSALWGLHGARSAVFSTGPRGGGHMQTRRELAALSTPPPRHPPPLRPPQGPGAPLGSLPI